MQYMGSKSKLAKELLPLVLAESNKASYYIEPFVGGANMIDKLNSLEKFKVQTSHLKKIGNDSNSHLIAMWKALQNGWIPPTNLTSEEYKEIRLNQDKFSPELVSFVGFLCSFGGKWFGGYAKNSKGYNYVERGSRNLLKQIKHLKDVEFTNHDFGNLIIPDNSIVYCDPPYKGTVKYKNINEFDHEKFWKWATGLGTNTDGSRRNVEIFISEYNCPEEYVDAYQCIKEVKHSTLMNKNEKNSLRVEKLYKLIK